MKLSNAMLLLITGFTAGAVTGLLMAPEEGYKTRRKLKRKAKKYKRHIERTASDYKDKANDLKDHIEGAVHDVKKRFA
jgi:gas vesicle protein